MLVDDHTAVRESLRRSMEAEGFRVVADAGDGEEAVRLAAELQPDVVLMDVSMPVLDGIEATRQLRAQAPHTQVVILTMHGDHDVVRRAISAGAIGYLVKDATIDDVIEAVRLAAAGATTLSPGLAASMLDEARREAERVAEPRENIISPREEEVLQLVAEGLSLPEIGSQLFISVKTVKNHLSSIYQKLEARDRTQAVIRAVKMGIIRLDDLEGDDVK
jgi:two-component system response regulator DegU